MKTELAIQILETAFDIALSNKYSVNDIWGKLETKRDKEQYLNFLYKSGEYMAVLKDICFAQALFGTQLMCSECYGRVGEKWLENTCRNHNYIMAYKHYFPLMENFPGNKVGFLRGYLAARIAIELTPKVNFTPPPKQNN